MINNKIAITMTRKEILEWGREMADKIFHGKNEEKTLKGWVARDYMGYLRYYSVKPHKNLRFSQWETGCSHWFMQLPYDMLPSIKWEDEDPTPCEITIKLK